MIICEHCGKEFLDIKNYFLHQADLFNKEKRQKKARELLKVYGW